MRSVLHYFARVGVAQPPGSLVITRRHAPAEYSWATSDLSLKSLVVAPPAVKIEENEAEATTLKKLREQMRILKETMKESFERGCNKCHDQDNDPDFTFDKRWEKVKHYGKD